MGTGETGCVDFRRELTEVGFLFRWKNPRCLGRILGSDTYFVKAASVHSDNARLKQIEFPTSVHLAFDELELADLTLGLSV